MEHPIAILISDVHYNIQTLKLADAAMRQAVDKANSLNVPLIVTGDLHDTKANLRGECVNAMIETFKRCHICPFIIVGNHDRLNEKAPEHSLNFLQEYATIVDKPAQYSFDKIKKPIHLFPYFNDPDEARYLLSRSNGIVIMHQGLKDSHMGDYIQDHSAITKNDVTGMRVISGHYHTRQSIRLPGNGTWDYVGNPYSLSWGEATDPEKGFQILYSDGSLEFIPTNLRKHAIQELTAKEANTPKGDRWKGFYQGDNLLWIKVTGSREELVTVTRGSLADKIGSDIFKLTLHTLDVTQRNAVNTVASTQPQILDSVIDGLTNTSDECKLRLKSLWKGL